MMPPVVAETMSDEELKGMYEYILQALKED